MKEMRLHIRGKGEMALELRRLCEAEQVELEQHPASIVPSVGVYLDSKRSFGGFLAYCEHWGIPIMQCSSGIAVPMGAKVPVVEVPNAAIPVILFMWFIRTLSAHLLERDMGDEVWTLEESHQLGKKDVSNTALCLAEYLGISRISSMRTRAQAHAHHRLVGKAGGVAMDFSLKVEGREPYARGMLYLARSLNLRKDRLRPGPCPVEMLL